jgi:hypothetical protein
VDEQMHDGALPAAVIAAAVIAFVGYASQQGSSHAVDFAVTGSGAVAVPASDLRVPPGWQRRAAPGSVLLVDVSWQAGESIGGGTYAVLVAAPDRWTHLGCRPECDWVTDEDLRRLGNHLPWTPYRLAAAVEAEESGDVTVAFRSPRGVARMPAGFAPTAVLVQTNGDDVLGVEPVPLS